MRTYQHITDSKAIKLMVNSIPDHWVIRELTERDYGIDLMIELFEKAGIDEDGYDFFESTGHVCYLQVKGTNKDLKVNEDDTLSFSIDKKTLFYVEKFSTPFLLARVYVKDGIQNIYFLWLQRYISDVLDVEEKNWRTKSSKTITLYIPTENIFKENFKKIEKIASRIKYLEELLEFQERYNEIERALILIKEYQDKFEYYLDIFTSLRRLLNLTTLLSQNNCCINKDCVLELIEYLKKVRNGNESPTQMEDFPHNFNFNQLLQSSINTRFIEEFIAENDGDTVY